MSRSTEQPGIRSQNKMILQLACRAQRDLQEASKVRLGPPPATLRNVRTDRRRGAPDLCRETIQLLPGKRPRRAVQGKGDPVGLVPDLHVAKPDHQILQVGPCSTSHPDASSLGSIRCRLVQTVAR